MQVVFCHSTLIDTHFQSGIKKPDSLEYDDLDLAEEQQCLTPRPVKLMLLLAPLLHDFLEALCQLGIITQAGDKDRATFKQ